MDVVNYSCWDLKWSRMATNPTEWQQIPQNGNKSHRMVTDSNKTQQCANILHGCSDVLEKGRWKNFLIEEFAYADVVY